MRLFREYAVAHKMEVRGDYVLQPFSPHRIIYFVSTRTSRAWSRRRAISSWSNAKCRRSVSEARRELYAVPKDAAFCSSNGWLPSVFRNCDHDNLLWPPHVSTRPEGGDIYNFVCALRNIILKRELRGLHFIRFCNIFRNLFFQRFSPK